jgi:uncharacterized protein DUF6876
MDFMEQNILRAELRQFTGSTKFYRHFTNAIIYTEGVQFLAEHACLYWLIDLIASLQPRALSDRALREFQLWEVWVTDGKALVVCSRDCDDVAFRLRLKSVDSALDYVRLYVERETLLLPTEH